MQFGMMQLRVGASMIDLVDVGMEKGAWARPEVKGGRNMDHLCVDVGPVEDAAMRVHLAAHGVAIIEEGVRSGAKGPGNRVEKEVEWAVQGRSPAPRSSSGLHSRFSRRFFQEPRMANAAGRET